MKSLIAALLLSASGLHAFSLEDSASNVTNADLDESSVTLQGNIFGGANQLPILDGSGLVSNVDVNGASVTKQGNTFGGANQLPILDGTGLISNIDIDPTSVTKMGAQFNGSNQLLQLDVSSFVPNLRIDPSSVTKMGDQFNGASQLLQADSSGRIASADLPPSTTLYVKTDGSTNTVAGSLDLQGRITSDGNAVFRANTSLGDAVGDLVTLNSGSFTFVSPSTVSFPAGSLIYYAEASACGKVFLSTTGGNLESLVSSAPATAAADWTTVNSATLNGTNAKVALLNLRINYIQDGTPTNSNLITYLRRTGSGIGKAAGNVYAETSIAAANERSRSVSQAWIGLDSNKDFDFSCDADTIETTQSCGIYLLGWCE